MSKDLKIGTSGWNYPTGPAKWTGIFYPPTRGRAKDFDELSFYATYFDFVEINNTFYGMPNPEVTAKWAARVPRGFEFAVKVNQRFTHPRMFREAVARTLRPQLGAEDLPTSALDALVTANQADIDDFRKGIEPLADAGKLGPLLIQFPASFRATHEARAHVSMLFRAFRDYALVVELRHRSWSDDATRTRSFLNASHVALAWIDEPKFKDSIRQQWEAPDRAALVYIRLHGRNAKDWWRGDKDTRYAYLYAKEELEPVASALKAAPRTAKKYAAFNNHPNARSVVNAAQLKAMLDDLRPHDYPETLIERYPQVQEVLRPTVVRVSS